MKNDIVTVIANLQRELQKIRDLALIAPTTDQRESMLHTASMVEKCIRDFDKHVD